MTKTVIYFVRHGDVHNPKRVLYGRLPRFGLSDLGRKQIEITGEKLKNEGIVNIYTSPMLRARHSAGIIGEILKLSPKISRHLIELRLIFEGMSSIEYKDKIQPFLFSEKYVKKGQESVDEVYKRMDKFFRNLIKKHSGKIILVISHGDPISIFVAKTSAKEFSWEYKKANYLKTGEFYKLEYEDGRYRWTKG